MPFFISQYSVAPSVAGIIMLSRIRTVARGVGLRVAIKSPDFVQTERFLSRYQICLSSTSGGARGPPIPLPGIVAGTEQGGIIDPNEDGTNAFILLGVCAFALVAIIASTSVLLSSLLRTPGYRTVTQSEGRLGGILITLAPLVVLLNALAGNAVGSPLYVPILMLNVLAASAGFWFLLYCIGHVLAQNWRTRVKALWLVLLLLGSWVAMPIYWWVFVARPRIALPPEGIKEKRTWQR